MKYLVTLVFAGLFSLAANAEDLSQYDYDFYAGPPAWPIAETNALDDQMEMKNIVDIQKHIEENPSASGSVWDEDVIMFDLLGNDIHAQ